MKQILWTSAANNDLTRLYWHLAAVNPRAALKVTRALVRAPEQLHDFPQLGQRVHNIESREVRRLLIGNYELRYQLTGTTIYILRIWHTRESR